ncbi:heterokaryon incompatibility, partial [Hyaloscypha hepaticicola]
AKPVYEALSYTWGDESNMRNIRLNGCLFAVSNNLYEALSHLRTSAAERTLWIDAISINQRDIDEKSSQIQIMPFIYERAQTVVVWLGARID